MCFINNFFFIHLKCTLHLQTITCKIVNMSKFIQSQQTQVRFSGYLER